MASERFYALWVNRNGQHLWEGPFAVEGVAWGRLQMIIDVQKGFVLRGTQMSNVAPQPGPDVSRVSQPADEFRAARPPDDDIGYGPWFVAQFDSECDGCATGIIAGSDSRSDGQGGWLCAECGEK